MHRLSKRKIVGSFWDLPNDYVTNPHQSLKWRRRLRKENRLMLADYLSYVWEERNVIVAGKTRKERKRKIMVLRAFRKRLMPALFKEAEKIIDISHENGLLFQDLEKEYALIKESLDKMDLSKMENTLISFTDIVIHDIPVCWNEDVSYRVLMKMRSLAFTLKDATLMCLTGGIHESTLQTFTKQGYYNLVVGCSVTEDNPSGIYTIHI